MSAATLPTRIPGHARWRGQMAGLLRLELRRHLSPRRAAALYLLAALPVALLLLLSLLPDGATLFSDPQRAMEISAGIFDALIVRTVIFFGCAWLFVSLMRADVASRSLHFYFLAPLTRESVMLGKYFAGILISVLLFGGATLVSFGLAHGPHAHRGVLGTAFAGPLQALPYLGVAILACIAYGALFSWLGLVFKNPVIAVLAVYGWEWINFLLPPLLQRLSILHYLQALAPLPTETHSIAFIAPPVSPAAAIASLLGLSAGLVFFGARQMRHAEINYGRDE